MVQGGELVMYGCMSGRPPALQWHSFVFGGLRVMGFNLRKWLARDTTSPGLGVSSAPASAAAVAAPKMTKILQAVGKLVASNLLSLNFTEWVTTSLRAAS